jgi:hypothetical protein
MSLDSTICPALLMAYAALEGPPSVPMSTMPLAAVHTNARLIDAAVKLEPTTWPALLTALADVSVPPSDPGSVQPLSADQTNA